MEGERGSYHQARTDCFTPLIVCHMLRTIKVDQQTSTLIHLDSRGFRHSACERGKFGRYHKPDVDGEADEVRVSNGEHHPRRSLPDAPSRDSSIEPTTITLTIISTAMAALRQCLRSSRALINNTTTLPTREITLPTFLVPAFAVPSRQRTSHFSTTSRSHSKIGAAPLSIPPEVTFRTIQPPPPASNARISRTQRGATVEIEGPLGKMSYPIPAYMSVEVNEDARTRTLSIQDAEDRQQRAMWGR